MIHLKNIVVILSLLNQTASFRLTLSGPVLLSDLISPPITLSATLLLLLFSPPSPRLLATTWGYSMLGLPVLHYPPELAQTHVHRVGDATQPSHPLPPPFPPALSLSQHQGLSNESALHIRWPEYWRFSFSIGPSNEYNDEKSQNVYSSYNMPDSVLSTIPM